MDWVFIVISEFNLRSWLSSRAKIKMWSYWMRLPEAEGHGLLWARATSRGGEGRYLEQWPSRFRSSQVVLKRSHATALG